MIKGKRVLITGGAGVIGSGLANRLAEANRVFVLDDLSSGFRENLRHPDIRFHPGSVLDDSLLREIFREGIEIVFHLAALFANQNSIDNPRKDLLVNGMGTLRILERSRDTGVERFVLTSSSCVYGNRQGPLSERIPLAPPDTPYAISKYLAEQYTNFFHRFYGLPTVVLRLFNCFGPGERPGTYRNVIPNFLHRALARKPLLITGSGEETRDFNYIENTVQGLVRAAIVEGAVGSILNIGSGVETKIRDLAEKINELTDNPCPIEFQKNRDWDSIARRRADISLAETVLDYRPEVGLDSGLRSTLDWFAGMRPPFVEIAKTGPKPAGRSGVTE